MTAPKKPTGAPTWYSRGHRLSEAARAALIEALGFPPDSQDPQLLQCLSRVEYWLGFYEGGKAAIDNAPSAAVYVRELETVKATALKLMTLLNAPYGELKDKPMKLESEKQRETIADDAPKPKRIQGINPFTRDTLMAHFEEAVSITGPDGIARATSAAALVVGACHSALQALETEKKSGRGRPKAGAREVVLTKLLELYGDYSKRRYEKRVRKGGIEALSEFEKHELAFIRAAFADIGADTFFDAIDPSNANGIDADAHANTQWGELIRPIRRASAKLRMRASQAVEPRPGKKARPTP